MMSNQLSPKTALIIILGSVMASIVAPIVVVIFETHYQQWLEDGSSSSTTETTTETIPTPAPAIAVSKLEGSIPKPEKPESSTPKSEVITPAPEIAVPKPESSTPETEIATSKLETTTPPPQVSTLKLNNARLSVKLWLDSPDKTQFKAGDQVKFFYQIASKDNIATRAYFTLFNQLAANEWAVVVSNEAVETGKLYSLPKGRKVVLRSGKSGGEDTRLRLTAGRKHVIAIVTPKPIDWKILGANIMRGLQSITVWGLKELVVEVN